MLIRTAGVPPAHGIDARLMPMSERDARGPEDHDVPLEWRAPSNDALYRLPVSDARWLISMWLPSGSTTKA